MGKRRPTPTATNPSRCTVTLGWQNGEQSPGVEDGGACVAAVRSVTAMGQEDVALAHCVSRRPQMRAAPMDLRI